MSRSSQEPRFPGLRLHLGGVGVRAQATHRALCALVLAAFLSTPTSASDLPRVRASILPEGKVLMVAVGSSGEVLEAVLSRSESGQWTVEPPQTRSNPQWEVALRLSFPKAAPGKPWEEVFRYLGGEESPAVPGLQMPERQVIVRQLTETQALVTLVKAEEILFTKTPSGSGSAAVWRKDRTIELKEDLDLPSQAPGTVAPLFGEQPFPPGNEGWASFWNSWLAKALAPGAKSFRVAALDLGERGRSFIVGRHLDDATWLSSLVPVSGPPTPLQSAPTSQPAVAPNSSPSETSGTQATNPFILVALTFIVTLLLLGVLASAPLLFPRSRPGRALTAAGRAFRSAWSHSALMDHGRQTYPLKDLLEAVLEPIREIPETRKALSLPEVAPPAAHNAIERHNLAALDMAYEHYRGCAARLTEETRRAVFEKVNELLFGDERKRWLTSLGLDPEDPEDSHRKAVQLGKYLTRLFASYTKKEGFPKESEEAKWIQSCLTLLETTLAATKTLVTDLEAARGEVARLNERTTNLQTQITDLSAQNAAAVKAKKDADDRAGNEKKRADDLQTLVSGLQSAEKKLKQDLEDSEENRKRFEKSARIAGLVCEASELVLREELKITDTVELMPLIGFLHSMRNLGLSQALSGAQLQDDLLLRAGWANLSSAMKSLRLLSESGSLPPEWSRIQGEVAIQPFQGNEVDWERKGALRALYVGLRGLARADSGRDAAERQRRLPRDFQLPSIYFGLERGKVLAA